MPGNAQDPDWLVEANEKYQRMLDHVKLTKQIRKLEPEVHDRGATAQAELAELDRKVKRVLDSIGVWADLHPSYHAYARALNKSQKDMVFRVDRIREHQILRDRWERRNLDSDILDALDTLLITDPGF